MEVLRSFCGEWHVAPITHHANRAADKLRKQEYMVMIYRRHITTHHYTTARYCTGDTSWHIA